MALFSADGSKLSYRAAPVVASGQAPSELWVADLASGRSERILAGQTVTSYDLSPTDQVVAAVTGAEGTRVPILPGTSRLRWSADGTRVYVAILPGVEILPYGDLALSPSAGVYAFSRTTTTRNLYRIPLP
jgi:hypothetical protein